MQARRPAEKNRILAPTPAHPTDFDGSMEIVMEKVIKVVGWTCIGVVSSMLVVVVVAAFGPLPGYVLESSPAASALNGNDRVKAETDVRTALLQAVGGVLLVIGAVTAWRQMLASRGQQLVARRIAVTDAFSKAVEQLSNRESVALRLGGIYSLDRVADDDPAEQPRVAEILSAFVRDHARQQPLPQDVAAALTVLSWRNWPCEVDLVGTCIAGAHLPGARLERARLKGADLSRTNLTGAVLRSADLDGADLRNADLSGADLQAARLTGAKLSGAVTDRATRWPGDFAPEKHGVLLR
ncbi:pentapeptide repeat-containing protein [Saccharopolyspora shandongensis]|uniref:pentapeptide repeat-containing protein n=1 Tax=Saccharopolyspora shandongensis TaxID=418495 RepID=UPI00341952F5